MEDNTQYKNSYVRSLMEMEGPTDKDLDDIKKEKPAKIPKKKYFGGKTDPKQVDTKAAIASHKKGIRAAGEASKSKPEDTNEARSSLELRRQATQQQARERRNNPSKPKPSRGTPSKPSKGDGMKSTSLTRKLKSGEYNRAGKGGGPRISRVGVGQDETKDKREQGSIRDHRGYHSLGLLFVEMEFPKGPTAKRYGALGRAKEGASKIKDPLVKREVAKTKANVDKKTKSKTNPKVSDLVQGSMNRRRGESRRKGTGGLPPLDKQTSTADAKRDRYRRMAPGDK